MIYEKRSADIRVKRDDLPIRSLSVQTVPSVQKTEPQKSDVPMRRRIKPVRAKYRSKKGAWTRVMAAAFVFAILLDRCVFDGSLMERAGFALKSGAKYALENIAEEKYDGQSTLYARLVSDADEQDIYYEEPVFVAENEETSLFPDEFASEAVSAEISPASGFVDGTRFYQITSLDLSADSPYSLSNATAFSPDMQTLSQKTPKALENISRGDGPLVLILHTHGEECYTEYTDMYPEGEATRSGDTQKNVVRVGQEIADTLEAFGVDALHCTTMHDSESFINAYSGSASTVKRYLDKYPSVRVVVDVHRDAVIRDDGESIKAVAEIAGEDYAQLMFVVGTNELGHNHPDWQDNLSLAAALQKSISDTYPSLCRSINLRNVPFNQQLSSGYLLLEVGTSANTLDEALRSARAFGENLARVISGAGN